VVQPATGATAAQQLPPHPAATTPAPVQPVDAPAPTGPVDFVPGLPGSGTPPPPPPVVPQPVPPEQDEPTPTPKPSWPETLESDGATARRPGKTRLRAPRDRTALLALGLTVLSVGLLEVGLAMRDGDVSYWQRIPLWSAFATACTLLALVAFAASFPAGNRMRPRPAWRLAAAGLAGLAVFWLLVVLPVVDTDRGFVLTAALGALGGALWTGPRPKN
jgi:hypothetical protein